MKYRSFPLLFVTCFCAMVLLSGLAIGEEAHQTAKVATAVEIGKQNGLPLKSLQKLPFQVGEKLVYDAQWLFFKAARFESIMPGMVEEDGRNLLQIQLHTVTTNTVAAIWTMDDWFKSYWDPELMAPRRFQIKIRESTVKKDKELWFDQEKGKVSVKQNEDPLEEFPIEKGSLDFFSAGHFARTKPLEIGETYEYPVFEDNKNYNMSVKPVKKESLRIMGKKVPTIMTQVKIKFEGAFQSRGQLWVWYSDDAYKAPVRIKVSSFFGTVDIKLVDYEGVDLGYKEMSDD